MKRIDVDRIAATDIAATYRELQPDGYWFDQDTMRFFKTQMPQYGYRDPRGVIWFVTAETGPDRKKRYSVRRMDPQGNIETIGEFQGFATFADARQDLRRQLQHENLEGETA